MPEDFKRELSDELLAQVAGGQAFFGYLEHTVKRGDTLERIAQRYHVSEQDIIDLNHIHNRNLLMIGDILRVPVRVRG